MHSHKFFRVFHCVTLAVLSCEQLTTSLLLGEMSIELISYMNEHWNRAPIPYLFKTLVCAICVQETLSLITSSSWKIKKLYQQWKTFSWVKTRHAEVEDKILSSHFMYIISSSNTMILYHFPVVCWLSIPQFNCFVLTSRNHKWNSWTRPLKQINKQGSTGWQQN